MVMCILYLVAQLDSFGVMQGSRVVGGREGGKGGWHTGRRGGGCHIRIGREGEPGGRGRGAGVVLLVLKAGEWLIVPPPLVC